MRLIFWACLFFETSNSYASLTDSFIETMSEEHSLQVFQSSKEETVPSHFRVVSWNIQKIPTQKTLEDLQSILDNSDFLLLQEAYLSKPFLSLIEKNPRFSAVMAKSFQDLSKIVTGVFSFSRYHPEVSFVRQSPFREPILKTPKMTLIQYFKIQNSNQKLLVLNLHGLNFVPNSMFEDQIFDLLLLINNHQGPILFSGDFNTWNDQRTHYLKTALAAYGLSKTPTYTSSALTLDHIFVRGLSVHKSYGLENITSSDHFPIAAEVSLETP